MRAVATVGRATVLGAWLGVRLGVVLGVGLATSAGLAGCASGAAGSDTRALLEQRVPDHVTVATRSLPGLGRVLVDGSGRALYMFPPDAGSRVSCTGACVGVWPPLGIARGDDATAGPGVNAADLATLPDPNTSGQIVTYAGYPLYRYSGDLTAGVARGQALFNNGGPWYVLTPAGQPVTTVPTGAA